MLIDIVLGIVAVVIFIRLFSSFGNVNENDFKGPKKKATKTKKPNYKAEGNIIQLSPEEFKKVENEEEAEFLASENNLISDLSKENQKLIEKVKQSHADFNLTNFVSGASMAFEMVLKAFSENDQKTLKNLLDKKLADELTEKIEHLDKDNKKVEIHLISIKSAKISKIIYAAPKITISVKFTSEQINLVKDKKTEEIIKGDKHNIEVIEDGWVFERNLNSKDPNWVIVKM